MSIRDKALGAAAAPLKERTEVIADWGSVRFVELDSTRFAAYLRADKGQDDEMRHAALVVFCAFDGEQLAFTPSDIPTLAAKPASVMRAWSICHSLNPWLWEKDEGAEKNLASGGSPTA